MPTPTSPNRVTRLAELVALLSLGTDLGLGQPMEHVMRRCLIALRLAGRLGLDESDRAVLYYSGLLAWVGCHTDAYEQAKWFGDEITMKHDVVDGAGPAWMVTHLGAGRPLIERARVIFAFFGDGVRDMRRMLTNHYLATDGLAESLGLGDAVRASLKHTFERWDGRGPLRQKGKQIHLSSRLVNLSDTVEVVHRMRGVDAAISVAELAGDAAGELGLPQRDVRRAALVQDDGGEQPRAGRGLRDETRNHERLGRKDRANAR